MSEITIGHINCEIHSCVTCGVMIVVPKAMVANLRKSGGYYHCISGHSQGWGKGDTENDKIRRERDLLRQEASRLEEAHNAALRAFERERDRANKAEKATKAAKKKASAGVCPCCHRTVRQMAQHIKTMHPEFRAEIGQ